VEDGCCVTCGVPEDVAPDIFGWTEKSEFSQCVVKRQPVTPDELTRTLLAVADGEMECIRYRGRDLEIQTRLVEMGEAAQCDAPVPPDALPLVRSRVTFASLDSALEPSAMGVAENFRSWRITQARGYEVSPVSRIAFRPGVVQLDFAWYQRKFHTVKFAMEAGSGRVMATADPGDFTAWGVARTLDCWLKEQGSFGDVRWYSEQQYQTGGPWRDTLV
jgi:hypothetical protein